MADIGGQRRPQICRRQPAPPPTETCSEARLHIEFDAVRESREQVSAEWAWVRDAMPSRWDFNDFREDGPS